MSRNPDVDRWLEAYDNPMKPVVAAIRELVLAHDARIDEAIKWQAPTFIYKGNIASFFPKAKKHASLMFHKGAEIPGDFSNLSGDGKEARTFKVMDLEDLDEKAGELKAVFTAWCAMRDG
ncbi:DUF1801 domain-containing protein [Hoeflea poritis]|uniref:DUF1801 domain-containing protein n=1 Tax=Hoeflea poritis TaxID=2993659 RepID=A0ABT4VNI5_9HYPH|nr:DUF1801 domain-containing protein [Hoeflea poritis]MDA4846274.1 DUF1801 domain-containing protein [Hoeflea poritis]